ncbi:MAG TPA: NrfD/PsrC family molybdoenzyme membrane anchor subunit, partial [Candidatus Dormibacteraeota bacterium]|nr:NrfD/PsrC family molybdoenzyme membrane anchor subunit [Candidatus Dormibacteraeota bacterium]
AAEHFVRAPQWTWYILFYFFFAGIAGGTYVIGTLLRLSGEVRDEAAARIAFLISFPATLICPILLSADLGVSWSRFWHMLVDVTPGATALSFKYWSPMSVGAWALLVFGFFSFVSFVDAWLSNRSGATFLPRLINVVFNIVGAFVALFVASYTGVLLSVTNQPVWSDTWALGGLFLASGLSGSAALIALVIRDRADAAFSLGRLHQADGYFSVLELILLIVFFVTVGAAATLDRELIWLPLWAIAVVGIAASLVEARGHMRLQPLAGGTMAGIRLDTLVVSILVLLGVLALRAAVIFSAQ